MLQGYESLRRRFAAISGPTFGVALMRDLGLAATRESKLIVPVKTRNLARSIHLGEVTPTSARVVASANYALFVEEDTKPHEITPNARKALRWAASASGRRLSGNPTKAAQRGGSGGLVFAKRVHHPGTKGKHFMRKGAEKAIEGAGLAGKIVATWNEAR
jgi:hypothetical protein